MANRPDGVNRLTMSVEEAGKRLGLAAAPPTRPCSRPTFQSSGSAGGCSRRRTRSTRCSIARSRTGRAGKSLTSRKSELSLIDALPPPAGLVE